MGVGVDLVGGLGGGGARLSTGEATRKVRVRGCGFTGVLLWGGDVLSVAFTHDRALQKQ